MATPVDLPTQLGYRMPAEWETHAATWLSWPHNEKSWPGRFELVPPAYANLVAAIARSEPVHINVNSIEMERDAKQHLRRAGVSGEIHFHQIPTNDAWCRDHGAIFVVRDSPDAPVAAVNWQYNAWGGKYPCDLDNQVAPAMASVLAVPTFNSPMVLEGGSIDVNGRGALLTTEACLLHPNRNPQWNRRQIEQQLHDFLGIDDVIWLKDGIAGDDTDGHIDDLARFVSPDVIVTTIEHNRDDVNFEVLRENLQRLEAIRQADGRSYGIVELPMPPAVIWNGERLPATYANFYIANQVVVVPGYDAATDAIAVGILSQLFPNREIVTVDFTDLIWGLGACHCLTQQVPAVFAESTMNRTTD